jgi:Protein of unknown function (DUF3761)
LVPIKERSKAADLFKMRRAKITITFIAVLVTTAGIILVARSSTATPIAPAKATALCKDGAYSYSQSRSRACSSHGGVSIWL